MFLKPTKPRCRVALCAANPFDSPDKHLSQCALALALDPFLRTAQLNVHVAVHTDESSSVLGAAPLQPNGDFVIDKGLQHRPGVERYELSIVKVSRLLSLPQNDVRRKLSYTHFGGLLDLSSRRV